MILCYVAILEPDVTILLSFFGDIPSFLKGILIDSLPLLCVVSFSPLILKSFLSQEGTFGPGFQYGDLKQPSYFL